jgi:hypothetical protein
MGFEVALKSRGDPGWSGPQVKISVIEENNKKSFMRIEVGNGFVTTEFGHELAGPKLLLASALNWTWRLARAAHASKRQEGKNSLAFL